MGRIDCRSIGCSFHSARYCKRAGPIWKKSLGELRKIVTTPYLQDGVTYDVQQHCDLEWIQLAVRALVNLYENTDSPLVRNQYEDWFTVALFGACIDTCMRNAQLGTDVNRYFTILPSVQTINYYHRKSSNIACLLLFIEPMRHNYPVLTGRIVLNPIVQEN